MALAAGAQFRAAAHRVTDQRLHRLRTAWIGHRAHVMPLDEPITDLDLASALGERGHESIVDALLYVKACGRDAYLAGVAELRGGEKLDCPLEIGVVEDDDRCVT